MKLGNLFILFMMLLPLGAVAIDQTTEVPGGWQPVGEGVEFQQFRLTDPVPVNIFVTRMDRNKPNVIIESSIAQGRLSGGVETVSGMAERYDQALNNWPVDFSIPLTNTWGLRNDVVVAINGFYYGGNVEPPGVPWSGQVHSGWYTKRYTDFESLSGFVWKMDRSAFIGECITHEPTKQIVYIANNDGDQFTYFLDGLNIPRGENELILYTPQYDTNTNTSSSEEGIEIIIEIKVPTFISIAADMPKGFIRGIRDGQGSTTIPFDHVVISAHGSAATDLKDKIKNGIISINDEVAIAQRVKDCVPPTLNRWLYAYAGVGGQFYFLRDGDIHDYSDDGQANVRDPRTAIAYNEAYIYFIVADGRDPGVSEGLKVVEMAEFAKNTLGAVEGIMQDGGGSSTMVVNNTVVNNTFCNNVFCTDKVFLPLVVNTANSATELHSQNSTSDPFMEWVSDASSLQRLVANGLMMVVVEPVEKSSLPYDPMDPITINSPSDIYLGPGTNYAVLSEDIQGDYWISEPINNLGGIYAKGNYWWKISNQPPNGETNVPVIEGWVIETLIEQVLKSRNSNEFKPR
jgi:hypothetical protein